MISLSAHGLRGSPDPSRRGFLIAIVGGGVMLGYARSGLAAPATDSPSDLFEPTIWYGIDPSGVVTVNIIRAEMGQHVGTALARIVADELEADWNKVKTVTVDSDPKWGLMVTGGSWSVWQTFPLFSRAGAAGRAALIEAGARLIGASPSQCVARTGAVIAGARSIGYGEIVRRGDVSRRYSPAELDKMAIKPVAERRLIGRSAPALDIPAKVNGTALFGIDAKVAGMVYARPKLPPTRYGAKVVSIDDTAA